MIIVTAFAGLLWWQMPMSNSSGPEFIFSSNRMDPIESMTLGLGDERAEIYPVESKKWMLRKPEGAPANPGAIRQILGAVARMRAENTVSEEGVETFGLEHPELEISVHFKSSVTTVRFGGAHPLSRRRYARRDGDPTVFLVDGSLFEMLRSAVKEVRDSHPFFFDVDTVTRIEILERPGKPDEAEAKKEAAHWLLRHGKEWELEGREDRLSGEDISARLKQLASLKVKRFIDEIGPTGSAAFGLEPPRVKLTIHRSGADPVVIDFGEARSSASGKLEFFARMPGSAVIFELPVRIYSDFLRPEEAFADRRAFAALSYDAVKLVCIRSGSKENGIQRRDGAWFRTPSCSSDPSGTVIRNGEQAVRELLQFQVLSFLSPGQEGADKRFGSPTGGLEFNGGEFEMVFGAEVEGEGEQAPRYAKIVGRSTPNRFAIVSSFDAQQILKIVK